jgi:hypothetical protein
VEAAATAVLEETTTHGAAHHSASAAILETPAEVMTPANSTSTRPHLKLKLKIYRVKEEHLTPATNKTIGSAAGSTTSSSVAGFAGGHSWSLPLALLHPILAETTGTITGTTTGSSVSPSGGPIMHSGLEPIDTATFEVMDDETERGIRCPICLVRLRDGDVVGDLMCTHLLHKDCLKDWLPRRNKCPLCQTTAAKVVAGVGPVAQNANLATSTSLSDQAEP